MRIRAARIGSPRSSSARQVPSDEGSWRRGRRRSVAAMTNATARYVFDQRHHRERERLGSMEALWDRGSRAAIESLGIAPGWRCLEVGAGAGSIAAWLADRVGTSGQVLATDLSTRHLAGLERPNLEIRRHDILRDSLPSDAFDLVHARLLVEHLGRSALERMVRCVRPGGWLLLEDLDWNAAAGFPDDEPMRRALDGLAAFMSRSGYDPRCGRRLIAELDRAGLSRSKPTVVWRSTEEGRLRPASWH